MIKHNLRVNNHNKKRTDQVHLKIIKTSLLLSYVLLISCIVFVGQRRATEYLMHCIEGIDTYL
jgi:hypothetical protein